MTSIIRVGQSQFVTVPIDEDSQERISTCLQSVASYQSPSASSEESADLREIFLVDTQKAYSKMVKSEETRNHEKSLKEKKIAVVQPDDVVSFKQFAKKAGADDEVRSSISKGKLG